MENAKRGFVFYFDNYFVVEDLPPDQRGWLLSALCVYAERVWRDPSVTMEEILDHYPQMSGQTRIACGFLGGGRPAGHPAVAQPAAGPGPAPPAGGPSGQAPGSRPGALLEPGAGHGADPEAGRPPAGGGGHGGGRGSRGTGLTGPHGRAHAVCYPGR